MRTTLRYEARVGSIKSSVDVEGAVKGSSADQIGNLLHTVLVLMEVNVEIWEGKNIPASRGRSKNHLFSSAELVSDAVDCVGGWIHR